VPLRKNLKDKLNRTMTVDVDNNSIVLMFINLQINPPCHFQSLVEKSSEL
jgi:hypothetical protein